MLQGAACLYPCSSRSTESVIFAGSSAEWLAWLLYGGGASDVEEENLHGGLGLSLKHASIVGLPMGMLVLAMAGALWHLAGRDQ